MNQQILELKTLNRRRYEHRVTKHASPEFLNLLRQASAKTCCYRKYLYCSKESLYVETFSCS